MSRSLFRAAKLAVLFTAMRTLLLSGGAVAAQQPVSSASTDSAASQPWGDVTDGLQLRVDAAGKNTESLTETVSQLYLMVQMRNVSDRPAAVDLTSAATYDFEIVWDLRTQELPDGTTGLHVGSLGSALAPGRAAVAKASG